MKRNRSITNRFIKYLIIIIIASNCLIFSFQYYITQTNTKNQSIEMGLNLMESNLTMIEQYFVDIDNIAYSLIYNREIVKFLKNDVDKAADLDWLTGVQSLYYNSRPDLKMYFYKEGKYDDVYTVTKLEKTEDYRYEKWYQELLWSELDKILITSTVEIQENTPEFIQSIIYKIYDIYSDDVVGYLKIDMDLESLKEKFLHSYNKIAGTTITDEENNVLFYDKLIIQLDDSVYDGQMTGVYEADDYLMSYGTSESTGWRVCMAMSREELFRNQYLMVRTLLIVLAAILIVTFAVSGRFFSIITVNFKRLVDGMKQVKQGNLQVKVEADTQDEIGVLISEFNEMLIQLNELIAAVEAKQILLNEAEIKALQQQINPHFMHNIMATIMGLASEGMNDEVIEVSECMSNMLRYNTRFENTTTLREEVEQIQNYVKVLKIRFEDRFEVFYDVDEDCMECVMVKFTLQPLVENAISHGLANTLKDGMLRIRVKREEDSISIMIFDNGTGIPVEQLEEMKRRLAETTERPLEYIDQYKSLGVLNVHLRLRMFYGDAYSIEIFSKPERGTCFAIKIPFLNEGKGIQQQGEMEEVSCTK